MNTIINFLYYAYIGVLIISLTICIINIKYFDQKSIIVFWVLIFAISTEILCKIAHIVADSYRPGIYHIYCLIDFFLMISYYSTAKYMKKHFIYIVGLIIYVLGVLNFLFLQHIDSVNTYMLIFESFIVILLSLFSLYEILINDEIKNVMYYPHFWFWVSFLLLYSGTLFFWICADLLVHDKNPTFIIAELIQEIINIVAYSIIGFTFYFYPKMVKNEH